MTARIAFDVEPLLSAPEIARQDRHFPIHARHAEAVVTTGTQNAADMRGRCRCSSSGSLSTGESVLPFASTTVEKSQPVRSVDETVLNVVGSVHPANIGQQIPRVDDLIGIVIVTCEAFAGALRSTRKSVHRASASINAARRAAEISAWIEPETLRARSGWR